jgi:hypothetical protein
MRPLAALLLAACTPAAVAAAPTAAVPKKPSAACSSPEHRQFDFWHGDWDVTVRARKAPDGQWAMAAGTQHIESILGGCATAEHFTAEGPGQPWAGASYSSWQPKLGKWRQTWVDDGGGYLAFTGGMEDGAMTLYGEPREKDGVESQMRMRFLEVRPESLHWKWERTTDDGATWDSMMEIDYRRR